MDRKIDWNNPVFDEIECVYEKAQNDDQIGNLLGLLEERALAEARENCDIMTIGGKSVTPEEFDGFSEWDKEAVIAAMGGAGLSSFNVDIGASVIVVRLSHLISRMMACTIFNILNRIEKIDGGIGLLNNGKWTMELQVPIGGKKGLFQWETLMMKLYPWISSVKETNTNETASAPVSRNEENRQPKADSQAEAAVAPDTGMSQKDIREEKKTNEVQPTEPEKEEPNPTPKKKSFFKKLFGK